MKHIRLDYVSCDEIPPCTPPDDKYLESWVPCDIFETHLFEDHFEQIEECSQGLDTNDEASLITDINGMMTIGLLLKIQPMILLKIFLRISSMMYPAKGVFFLRLMKVVKKNS